MLRWLLVTGLRKIALELRRDRSHALLDGFSMAASISTGFPHIAAIIRIQIILKVIAEVYIIEGRHQSQSILK